MTEAFSFKIEYADGTELIVPVSFDTDDLTDAEIRFLLEYTDDANATAVAFMFVKVARAVPDLDFEVFKPVAESIMELDDSYLELVNLGD